MPWTTAQKKAIQDRGHTLLVSAAAGSGKTAVLIERIKELIINDAYSLKNMLIVTFTRAAASEMRERLRKELTSRAEQSDSPETKRRLESELSFLGRAKICTYDSFVQSVIKEYYYISGIDPSLKICDNFKNEMLRGEAMDEMFKELYDKKDPAFYSFLDHYTDSRSDSAARDMITSLYSYAETLPDMLGFIKNAGFDSSFLFNYALDAVFSDVTRALLSLESLRQLFTDSKAPVLAGKLQVSIDRLSAVKEEYDAGHRLSAFEHLKNFEGFEILRAPASEKSVKASLDSRIKALYDKGGKKIISDLIKNYSDLSLEKLDFESSELKQYLAELSALTLSFHKHFTEKKLRAGLMSFSDSVHSALEILQSEEVRREYREKYKIIMVDEYQDSSPIQEELISLISGSSNVFMVGDVKQSIYKFRHAEPGLFIKKYDDIRSGRLPGAGIIDLSNNFRSKKPIIDFVNRCFSGLMNRRSCGIDYDSSQALYEGSPYTGEFVYEPELYLIEKEKNAGDENIEKLKKTELEAALAVDIIKKYRGKTYFSKSGENLRLDYGDMVILLRSAKGKAEIFYDALVKSGIPVYLERNEGYFDTPEVSVFVNLLRIIDNLRQDVALISVLYFPVFGFSADELAEIRILADRKSDRRLSFAEAFLIAVSADESPLQKKCRSFYERVLAWRRAALAMPLHDFIHFLQFDSNIMLFVRSLSFGSQRAANLSDLTAKARSFGQENYRGLSAFISYIDIISDKSFRTSTGQTTLPDEDSNAVRIMTIHKSKGLEFPFVLLPCAADSGRKAARSAQAVFHKDFGCSMYLTRPEKNAVYKTMSHKLISRRIEEEALAEEIRVLYVAATRPRDFFIMSAVVQDAGELQENKESLTLSGSYKANFLEMAYPYFRCIHTISSGSLGLLSQETHAAYLEKLRYDLKNGFKTNPSLMRLSEEEIKNRLSFDYRPSAAGSMKTKYSVSEISSELAEKKLGISYREEPGVPSFISAKKLSPAALGTAYHSVMEHLDFDESLCDESKVRRLISDMEERGILSADEAAALNASRISEFFRTDIGRRVCHAGQLRKEMPFVFKKELDGRNIIIQGIIDCWFEEDGNIYLLDYKTNYISRKNLEASLAVLREEYSTQLLIYKEALEMFTGRKVKESYLYLFSAGIYITI